MNIITVTLNPAIDIHVPAEDILIGIDGPYTPLGRDSGGKGVNVSRALAAFGVDNLCCVAVGEENSDEYLTPLRETGMNLLIERVAGSVRTNLHANTEKGDFVIAGQGACVDNSSLLRLKSRILPMISEGDFLCLCGGLPPLTDKKYLIEMLLDFKSAGARLILDSRSFDLEDLCALYPYMIKPNLDELIALTSSENVGKEQLVSIVSELLGNVAENIFVSLGADGSFYAAKHGCYTVSIPNIGVISTTGAGDSMIAGYLYAISKGMSIEDTLCTASAFGAAACLREGTLPPLPRDVESLREKVFATKYA